MSQTYQEHGALYDAAFAWDVEDEIDFLLERFGPSCRTLLEPGCGSGRLFPAFGRRGVRMIGVDRSEPMLVRARRRMKDASLPQPHLIAGDMVDFDAGERADGAVIPISTLCYLHHDEQAAAHLRCVARHLERGGRYMVQMDLVDLDTFTSGGPDDHSQWEVDGPAGRIRCTWSGIDWDPRRGVETQLARFEVLSGPDAGSVHEDTHEMRLWSWAQWRDLIEGSPFRQVAAYDSRLAAQYAPLPLGRELEGIRLPWHELELG